MQQVPAFQRHKLAKALALNNVTKKAEMTFILLLAKEMLTDMPEQNTEKDQLPCTQIYVTITDDLIKNKTTGAGQYIRCLSSSHSPLYLSPLLYINSPQPQRSSSSHSPWWEIHNISNSPHNPLTCKKYPAPHPRLP